MTWTSAARWVLRRALPPDDADAILGDLLEDARGSGRYSRVFLDACSVALHRALRRSQIPPSKRRNPGMATLTMDLKYALRSLAKRPSFPVIVLATIALGIGAATAIFSIVEAILIRPLPFHDPDRLVYATELDGERLMTFAWPNYVDYRDRATSYESIACHQINAVTVVGEGMARRVDGRTRQNRGRRGHLDELPRVGVAARPVTDLHFGLRLRDRTGRAEQGHRHRNQYCEVVPHPWIHLARLLSLPAGPEVSLLKAQVSQAFSPGLIPCVGPKRGNTMSYLRSS